MKMKPYTPGRRIVSKHLSSHTSSGSSSSADWATEGQQGSAMDFSPEELREFLAADLLDVKADPEFRERLRSKLWALVRSRYARRDGGGEP